MYVQHYSNLNDETKFVLDFNESFTNPLRRTEILNSTNISVQPASTRNSLLFSPHSSLRVTRARVWKARIESPLFNVKTYAMDLERLYRVLWEKYQRGEKPDHVGVN